MHKLVILTKHCHIFYFIIIAFVFSAAVLYFINNDATRPTGEEWQKLDEALYIYEAWTQNGNYLAEKHFHSILYFYIPALICFALNEFSYTTCVSINIFYCILTMIFIGLILQHITKNKMLSLLAVFLSISMHEFVIAHARSFVMEVGLMATVCMSMFLLIKTDYFKHRVYSILFGLSAVVGMIMKHTYLLYMIGPFYVYVIYALRESEHAQRESGHKVYVNIACVLLLSLFLFCLYAIRYLDVGSVLWLYVRDVLYEWEVDQPFGRLNLFITYLSNMSGVARLWWHYRQFNITGFNVLLLIPHFIIVISIMIGFVNFILTAQKRIKYLYLSSFFIPLIVLSIIIGYATKRYLLPVIPSFTIIMALGIQRLPIGVKKFIISSLVLATLCIFAINILDMYHNMESQDRLVGNLFAIQKRALFSGEKILLIAETKESSIMDKIRYSTYFYDLDIEVVQNWPGDSVENNTDNLRHRRFGHKLDKIMMQAGVRRPVYYLTDDASVRVLLLSNQGNYAGEQVLLHDQFWYTDDYFMEKYYQLALYELRGGKS